MRVQITFLAEPQRDPLTERGGVEVRDLLELRQAADQRRITRDVADPDAGDDRLTEGPGVERPRIARQGRDRRERIAVVPEVVVSIIFQYRQPGRSRGFRDSLTPLRRERHARGVLEVGEDEEQFWGFGESSRCVWGTPADGVPRAETGG